MKIMAYLAVFTSLIGASVFTIDLGAFQVSIFRGIIIVMTISMTLRALNKNARISFRSNKENIFSIKVMIIWLIYAIFTLAWVKDLTAWFIDVYFIGLGVVCAIIFSLTFKKNVEILKCFQAMALMSIFHNVIGWYEIITGHYMFLAAERGSIWARYNAPVSIFYNTNDFATFMLLSVFIAYICLANSKNVFSKCIYVVTIISSTYLLIMTGSRANMLGFICSFTVFTWLSLQNKRVRRVILPVLIGLFTFVLLMPDKLNSFFSLVSDNLYFNFSKGIGSDIIRLNLVKNGLLFLVNTFGFGTGAGNLEYWMLYYGKFYTDGIMNIHNWWVEILASYGIIIFTFYVAFYIKLFKSLYKKFRTESDKKDISISLGLMCCMAGYAIGSISSSSNISTEWLWVFWAVVIAYQGITKEISVSHLKNLSSQRIQQMSSSL